VGLGFAMLENLIYILSSAFGGPIAFTMTALIRGIGSIPGHAFWTGLTGTGLGWYLMTQKQKANIGVQTPVNVGEKSKESQLDWKLLDPKSGEFVGGDESNNAIVAPATQLLGEFRMPLLEPMSNLREKGGLPTPKHPIIGLLLAMAGHAFWNGSLTFLSLIGEALDLSEFQIGIIFLIWSVILVTGILLIGWGIIRGVINTPNPRSG